MLYSLASFKKKNKKKTRDPPDSMRVSFYFRFVYLLVFQGVLKAFSFLSPYDSLQPFPLKPLQLTF